MVKDTTRNKKGRQASSCYISRIMAPQEIVLWVLEVSAAANLVATVSILVIVRRHRRAQMEAPRKEREDQPAQLIENRSGEGRASSQAIGAGAETSETRSSNEGNIDSLQREVRKVRRALLKATKRLGTVRHELNTAIIGIEREQLILRNKVDHEFDDIYGRQRSWLATPYPGTFRLESSGVSLGVLKGLGLTWKGEIGFYPLCEERRCEWLNKYPKEQQKYSFTGNHLKATPELVGNAVKLTVVVIGAHHLADPLHIPIHIHVPYAHALELLKEIHKAQPDLLKHVLQKLQVLEKIAQQLGKATHEPLERISDFLSEEAAAVGVAKLVEYLAHDENSPLRSRTQGWKTIKNQLEALIGNSLNKLPGYVAEPGSTEHLFLGKLMEKEDDPKKKRVLLGGLVRVLKVDDKTTSPLKVRSEYRWVCGDCRRKHYRYSLDVGIVR